MTGIIAMMMMRVRTVTREMSRVGEYLRIGSGRRIAMIRHRPLGLAGAAAQPQVGTMEAANIQMVNKSAKPS